VWVFLAAPTDEECKKLRRACGAEAQVVAMSLSPSVEELKATNADVAVLGAFDSFAVAARDSGAAVVWVGHAAPEGAHASVADDESLTDALPSAITKALIARRTRS